LVYCVKRNLATLSETANTCNAELRESGGILANTAIVPLKVVDGGERDFAGLALKVLGSIL
jgi:hypothetical protein